MFSFQSRCNNSTHFEAWDPGAETNPGQTPAKWSKNCFHPKYKNRGERARSESSEWNTAEHLDNSVKKHNRSTRQRAAQESEQAKRWKVSRAQVKLIKAGNSRGTRTNTGSVKSKSPEQNCQNQSRGTKLIILLRH